MEPEDLAEIFALARDEKSRKFRGSYISILAGADLYGKIRKYHKDDETNHYRVVGFIIEPHSLDRSSITVNGRQILEIVPLYQMRKPLKHFFTLACLGKGELIKLYIYVHIE